MDRQLLINNIVGVAKIGLAYGLPIIHSTVNVKTGLNKPPIPQLCHVLKDLPTYDRTTINSWEDVEFIKAVKATGRKKLIMTALWTEACLSFPALDALREGYEVYPVVDAVGVLLSRHMKRLCGGSNKRAANPSPGCSSCANCSVTGCARRPYRRS